MFSREGHSQLCLLIARNVKEENVMTFYFLRLNTQLHTQTHKLKHFPAYTFSKFLPIAEKKLTNICKERQKSYITPEKINIILTHAQTISDLALDKKFQRNFLNFANFWNKKTPRCFILYYQNNSLYQELILIN